MADTRILIVDDEPELCRLLEDYLDEAGYMANSVHTAADMRASILADPPHLVLLDLRLPDADGFDLARELSTRPDIGVIIISARGESVDRVIGLEIGADDYIAKPFEEREVLARVRTVLRRIGLQRLTIMQPEATAAFAQCAGWSLYFSAKELVNEDGRSVHLTSQEFEMLKFFTMNSDRVASREELFEQVFGPDGNGNHRSIDNLILKLRRKIERDPAFPEIILSVRGAGYKFAVRTNVFLPA